MTKFPLPPTSLAVKMSLFARVPGTALVLSIRAKAFGFVFIGIVFGASAHVTATSHKLYAREHPSQATHGGVPPRRRTPEAILTGRRGRAGKLSEGGDSSRSAPSKDFGDKQGAGGESAFPARFL
jgi:hypothetical protein